MQGRGEATSPCIPCWLVLPNRAQNHYNQVNISDVECAEYKTKCTRRRLDDGYSIANVPINN